MRPREGGADGGRFRDRVRACYAPPMAKHDGARRGMTVLVGLVVGLVVGASPGCAGKGKGSRNPEECEIYIVEGEIIRHRHGELSPDHSAGQ